MKPLGEVQRSVLASVPLLEPEATRVQQARGLVLAQEVIAPFDVPPFANSAMDGFAVQAADTLSCPFLPSWR
jgi:molybdopterin molybdotransferase